MKLKEMKSSKGSSKNKTGVFAHEVFKANTMTTNFLTCPKSEKWLLIF